MEFHRVWKAGIGFRREAKPENRRQGNSFVHNSGFYGDALPEGVRFSFRIWLPGRQRMFSSRFFCLFRFLLGEMDPAMIKRDSIGRQRTCTWFSFWMWNQSRTWQESNSEGGANGFPGKSPISRGIIRVRQIRVAIREKVVLYVFPLLSGEIFGVFRHVFPTQIKDWTRSEIG